MTCIGVAINPLKKLFLILWIPTYGYLTLSLASRGMIVAEWSCTLSGSPSRGMQPTLSPNLTPFILPPSSLHLCQKRIHKRILNHPHCQCILGNISNAVWMRIYFIIVTVHLWRAGAHPLRSQACRGSFLLQLLLLWASEGPRILPGRVKKSPPRPGIQQR